MMYPRHEIVSLRNAYRAEQVRSGLTPEAFRAQVDFLAQGHWYAKGEGTPEDCAFEYWKDAHSVATEALHAVKMADPVQRAAWIAQCRAEDRWLRNGRQARARGLL